MNNSQASSNSNRTSENSCEESDKEDEWVYTASKKTKSSKSHADLRDPNLRVVVYSKVMTFCLPPELASYEILKGESYFGRYGKVTNVVINTDRPTNETKETKQQTLILQAFITYENELDASLAIISMQGYSHCGLWTKTSFGSVKYCQHFLDGQNCDVYNCYYIHRKSEQFHISCKIRDNYKNHLSKARILLSNSAKYIAEKEIQLEKKLQKNKAALQMACTCVYEVVEEYVTFPCIMVAINKLLQQGVINRKQYEAHKAFLKNTKNVPIVANQIKSTPKKMIVDERDYPSLSEISGEDSSNKKSNQNSRKKPVYVLKARSRSQAFASINSKGQQILNGINPELSKLVHNKLLLKTIVRRLQPRSRLPFAAGLNQKAVNADCLKYSKIISRTVII